MSQASYIRDMMTDPVENRPVGESEVASFYAKRNVLLTGGSGFLGRLLIDKILRSCPDVNTLFLLLRAKKGKSPEERFKELFDDVIFDRLRKERPGFAEKVVLIEGDMVQVGLGLTPEQKERIRSTHIIIHGAATVGFDETMRIATNINVRGTEELLSFAEEMTDLKAFVHISTAYCNCVRDEIDEKFYPPPIDSKKLLSLLDILDDATLDHLTPVLLGKWPNTYAFTKAVAEDVVRRKSLPVCIVRPSIVVPTSKEPIAGWINNIYGPTGAFVGAAVGLVRTMHCDENMVADMVPADYVINTVIVAAWDIAKARNLNSNAANGTSNPETEEPPIYNVVSSCQKPITWGKYMKYNSEMGKRVPSVQYMWYFCLTINKHLWVHNLYEIFFHLLPAVIIDSLALLIGRKPTLWKVYTKIRKFGAAISYFSTQQWRFDNNNFLRLAERSSPVDRSEFDLDIGGLNWEDYFHSQVRGIRLYILKDPLGTLPQARARYAKLKVLHYTVITVFYGFLLWLLWTCLRFITPW